MQHAVVLPAEKQESVGYSKPLRSAVNEVLVDGSRKATEYFY